MENEMQPSFDYRQYDRIWQRVDPELNPYPEARAAMASGCVSESAAPAAELPCCMASASGAQLELLRGFIEGELEDRRTYLTYARCAPGLGARQTLQQIAREEGMHARRLLSVYFLITGECYKPVMPVGRIAVAPWCELLRTRWHEESCGSLAYRRAAKEANDECLAGILQDLSADEARHARRLLCLLEQSLA